MKIKRIEICGFKSFVDKTSISFPGPDHLDRRPERVRKVERGRRDPVGHGRAVGQAPAWPRHGGRHLRGLRVARPGRFRRGVAVVRRAEPERRRGGGGRGLGRGQTRRDRRDPAALPGRAERLSIERRSVAAARRGRVLPRHRGRLEGLRHHRAGANRVHRLVAAGGSPRPHRRGGRNHALQVQEEGGRAPDGLDAAAPPAGDRHRRRDRGASPLAAAAGAEGRALQALQGRAARSRPLVVVAALSRSSRRREVGDRRARRGARAPRSRRRRAGGRGGGGRGRAAVGRRRGERAGDGQGRSVRAVEPGAARNAAGGAPRVGGDRADVARRGRAQGGGGAAGAGDRARRRRGRDLRPAVGDRRRRRAARARVRSGSPFSRCASRGPHRGARRARRGGRRDGLGQRAPGPPRGGADGGDGAARGSGRAARPGWQARRTPRTSGCRR